MIKSTTTHKKYWTNRKIDWKQAYFNPTHPHRKLFLDKLKTISFASLLEVGCAAGANLFNISQAFPQVRIGGIDINAEAIITAKEILPQAVLEVMPADNIFLSDKCTDVVITDACLIYQSPFVIKRVLGEIKRVCRSQVIFCEFHSKSLFKRQILALGGYYAYDYEKLLKKMGFYDIEVTKIPKEMWSGFPWEEYGYIISAKI